MTREYVEIPTQSAIDAARDSWHKIAQAATRASDAGANQLCNDLTALARQQEQLVKALEKQRDRLQYKRGAL